MLGLGGNGNFLFNKNVNGFLTKMDDSTSMVSLALRDGVESSGRTVMEYKRDKHGGRERLIEEGATMVIWGFGINWMKKAYDWMAKDAFKAIALPDLDTSLLKSAHKPAQTGFMSLFSTPSAQTLVDAKGLSTQTQTFISKMGQNEAYQKLGKVVESQGTKYAISNMAKFLFATGVPVAAIAFGIPTFNQWLTQRKIHQQNQKKSPNGPQNQVQNPFGTPAGSAQSSANAPLNAFTGLAQNQVSSYSGSPMPSSTFPGIAATGAAMAGGIAMNPANTPFATRFGAQKSPHQSVQFGAMPIAKLAGDASSAFLQNERMNTLLVDGVISGGRIWKARNWQERSEIIFREGSIIAFLYFGQRILQEQMTKMLKGGSNINFDATRFINRLYGEPDVKVNGQKVNDLFFKHFKDAKADLHEVFGHDLKNLNALNEMSGGAFWKNLRTEAGRAKIRAAQQTHFEMEQKLVGKIQQYFMANKTGNVKHNLILEAAKECGWIPTFDGQIESEKALSQIVADKFNNTVASIQKKTSSLKKISTQLQGGEEALAKDSSRFFSQSADKALNITKKIDTESIVGFVKHVDDLILKNGSGQSVQQLMKKAVGRRAGAWLASNAVCTLFLSLICPWIQHQITYKRTGKNYFPGVQPSAQ